MAKVYVPSFTNNSCAHIQSSDIIRVYDSVPTNNSTIHFTDYYIKSSYISNDGYQTFNQYSTIPSCISTSNLTSDFYYRNDFANILIIFFIIVLVCFYFPFKIFGRMFGRWLKV